MMCTVIILTSRMKKLRLKVGSGFRVSAASLPRTGWVNSGKLSLSRSQFSLLYNRNRPTSKCFLKSSPLFTTKGGSNKMCDDALCYRSGLGGQEAA